MPGGLYTYDAAQHAAAVVSVNNRSVTYQLENGYLVIDREWAPGDKLTVSFPMEIRRVYSRDEVKANKERVALQRGPLVYCVEGADNEGRAMNLVLPKNASVQAMPYQVLAEPVIGLQAEATVLTVLPGGDNIKAERKKVIAIPYYTWNNRGAGQMQVWLPQRIIDIKIN